MTAESGDRTKLLLEIDATSSRAALESGLGHEITQALRESGLPTTITINTIGDHQEPETRDVPGLGAMVAAAVIYRLRIYLPNALTEFMVKKAVDELDQRIRSRRRRSGNTRLEVPIYGPDGKTVIHTVERDADPTP